MKYVKVNGQLTAQPNIFEKIVDYIKNAVFVKGAVKGFWTMKRTLKKYASKIALGEIKTVYGASGNMWLNFDFKIPEYANTFYSIWDLFPTGECYLGFVFNGRDDIVNNTKLSPEKVKMYDDVASKFERLLPDNFHISQEKAHFEFYIDWIAQTEQCSPVDLVRKNVENFLEVLKDVKIRDMYNEIVKIDEL